MAEAGEAGTVGGGGGGGSVYVVKPPAEGSAPARLSGAKAARPSQLAKSVNKGWAMLKKAIRENKRGERATSPSVRQRDMTSEQGLREIIDMFQTRVLEGIPKVPRSSSLKERRISTPNRVELGASSAPNLAPASSSSSTAGVDQDKAANRGRKEGGENKTDGNGNAVLAFKIQRKWTTDKFTTNRNRLEDMGRLLIILLPLMDFIVIFLLMGELLLFPILVSFQPTDKWMYTYQVGLEVMLIMDFFKNVGVTIMHARLQLREKDLSVIEQGRRNWLALDFVAAAPINSMLGRDVCMGSRYLCSIPIALNFLKLSM